MSGFMIKDGLVKDQVSHVLELFLNQVKEHQLDASFSLVGGAVRDLILGGPIKDLDIHWGGGRDEQDLPAVIAFLEGCGASGDFGIIGVDGSYLVNNKEITSVIKITEIKGEKLLFPIDLMFSKNGNTCSLLNVFDIGLCQAAIRITSNDFLNDPIFTYSAFDEDIKNKTISIYEDNVSDMDVAREHAMRIQTKYPDFTIRSIDHNLDKLSHLMEPKEIAAELNQMNASVPKELRDAYLNHEYMIVRLATVKNLGERGLLSADEAEKVLMDDAFSVRAAAVELLVLGDQLTQGQLDRALLDENEEVRMAGYKVGINGDNDLLLTAAQIESAFTDKDCQIRFLMTTAMKDTLQPHQILHARADDDADVRRLAYSIGELTEQDFEVALADKDKGVACAIAKRGDITEAQCSIILKDDNPLIVIALIQNNAIKFNNAQVNNLVKDVLGSVRLALANNLWLTNNQLTKIKDGKNNPSGMSEKIDSIIENKDVIFDIADFAFEKYGVKVSNEMTDNRFARQLDDINCCGKILEVFEIPQPHQDKGCVLQSLGRGTAMLHPLNEFEVQPVKGQMMNLVFKDGKMQVPKAVELEVEGERELAR